MLVLILVLLLLNTVGTDGGCSKVLSSVLCQRWRQGHSRRIVDCTFFVLPRSQWHFIHLAFIIVVTCYRILCRSCWFRNRRLCCSSSSSSRFRWSAAAAATTTGRRLRKHRFGRYRFRKGVDCTRRRRRGLLQARHGGRTGKERRCSGLRGCRVWLLGRCSKDRRSSRLVRFLGSTKDGCCCRWFLKVSALRRRRRWRAREGGAGRRWTRKRIARS